tara:strand:+ start:540 stop:662 length:123 start_codon:yes stop_codon:yes gene_type:complete
MDKWNKLIFEYLTGTALAGRIILVVMAVTFLLVYLTDKII